MASRKTYNPKGFTLIEIIISVSIMTAIFALGIFMSVSSYQGYIFRSETSILTSALERARSRSMSNISESPHGVCFISPNYIIFEGTVCDTSSSSEKIPAGASVNISGISDSSPVVFEQLSGRLSPALPNPNDERIIEIEQNGKVSILSINNEGRINW